MFLPSAPMCAKTPPNAEMHDAAYIPRQKQWKTVVPEVEGIHFPVDREHSRVLFT
jgi:hypothetical protein